MYYDNCHDGSDEVVACRAASMPFRIRTGSGKDGGVANAGLARRQAARLAIGAAPGGVLLTTDADSEPAPDWIAANLRGLACADIIAGRIIRSGGIPSPLHDRIERYYHRLHLLRRGLDPVPWEQEPTHHWTSGASLAMSATVYRALGGFAPLPNGEDAALCDAAARSGYRVRRDARVTVRTSARRRGRAPDGFAGMLAALDAAAAIPTTCHPDDEAWRYRMHAEARLLHGSGGCASLADRLLLPRAEVEQVARECTNGEAFAARIVGAPPGGMRRVTLDQAERMLAMFDHAELDAVG